MADQRIAPWAGLAVLVSALILITHTRTPPPAGPSPPAAMRIGTPASCTQDLPQGCTGERALIAYLTRLNDQGGIAGHPIERLLPYDDTQQTEPQLQKWAEDKNVLALLSSPHPRPRRAPRPQPQAGTSLMFPRGGRDDRHRRPWSMSASLTPHTQGSLFAQYLLGTVPGTKIGLLYQDNAFGQGVRQGFINALGDAAPDAILQEQTVDPHATSLQTQVLALRNSGANVLVNLSPFPGSAESIARVHAIGWQPLHLLADPPPAALNSDATRGVVTAQFLKHPDDPQWQDDPDVAAYIDFARQHFPEALHDPQAIAGYTLAQVLEHILQRSSTNLSRDNLHRQAATIHNLSLPMLLPGIKVNTTPKNLEPFQQGQLARFDDKRWVRFGSVRGDTPASPVTAPASGPALSEDGIEQ